MSDNEGWIPHDGREMPCDGDLLIDVILSEANYRTRAKTWSWEREAKEIDRITFWRPHKNADGQAGQEGTTAPSQEGHAAGPLNQCDGCMRGLPVDEKGIHHDEQTFGMWCTADRYAAGPACSAPDKGALKEQSDAWFAVCAVLSEIDPDWITRAKCGMDAAVLAVKALANKAKDSLKPVPCEKCGMDLVLGCQVCAAGWPSKLSDIEQARRDALKPDEALIEEIAEQAFRRWQRPDIKFVQQAAWAIREYIRRSAGKEKR